jgi:hypothetical protein
MLTKPFFTTLLLCLLFTAITKGLNAQNQLNGNIAEANHQALIGANVLLLNSKDSSLVKGQLSGDNGAFRFDNLDAGAYILRVTMLGFADYMSKIIILEAKTGEKNLAAIELLENASQLNEVQIVAKKPFFEQKIDRMLINVAGSSVNAGGNALQVLQRSPGIMVNKQAGISMSGKNGVIIMINGKVSRMPPDAVMAMLEGLNADNIERIELIHTPPASFDIVLKQSQDAGLNGNYSINAGYGMREKAGGGGSLNFRRGKVNLFGSGDYNYNVNPQQFGNYRGFYRDGKFLKTDGISVRSPFIVNKNARLGADFQVSPKTVIGVVGTYFDRYWDLKAENNIRYSTDKTIDYQVLMTTNEINKWTSATSNLNFSHQLTPSKTLTADVDYVYYKIHNPSDYDIRYIRSDPTANDNAQLRVSKETPINIVVAKADYTQNLGTDSQFEAGIKASRSFFDNDVRVDDRANGGDWVTNAGLTSHFKLQETVSAAYTAVSFKGNTKTDFKLGLRYEYTNTNLGSVEQPNVVDRQYGRLFPSFYVSRKISEVQQINLSFSRRIGRPGFTQLAPYLIFYDPTTVQGGNPALQPVFVPALRVDYKYKTVGITVEYNLQSPSIRDQPLVDETTNTQVNRPENIGKTHTTYTMINFPLQPVKWWEIQTTFYAAYQLFDMSYEGQKLRIPTQFVGFNTNNSFRLPKKWSIDVSAFLQSANKSGLVLYKTNGSLNFGLQKDFGERWGKLTFNVTDIFLTNNWYGIADRPDINLLVINDFRESERTFMLTWTNTFGNKKLKGARERERGASEEMRRL